MRKREERDEVMKAFRERDDEMKQQMEEGEGLRKEIRGNASIPGEMSVG